MGDLASIDVFGWWLRIFLTFCILSFLYKDNPIYKLAEHLFIGVSIGYVVAKQYFDVIEPKLVERISGGQWWYYGAVLLSLLLLAKAVSRRWAWVGRYPIAFVVAFYAGVQVNGVLKGDFGPQLVAAMRPVVVEKVDLNTAPVEQLSELPGMSPGLAAQVVERRQQQPLTSVDELWELPGLTDIQREDLAEARGLFGGALSGIDARASVDGGTYWFGTFSLLLMLLGLIAGLVYFYFSVEHKGAIGKVSRFGVWILMLGFGAAFGATVQGRLSLAIGRAMEVLGRQAEPALNDQVHFVAASLISIVIVVLGVAMWELGRRRARESGSTDAR